MFLLHLITVGKQKEDWQRAGIAEYLRRLGAWCRTEVTEVKEYRLPDDPSPAQIREGLEKEGRAILQKAGELPIVALCIEGEQLSSEELAEFLRERQQKGPGLAFVIGGSFGLSDEVKQKAVLRLSVSRMTFPHQLFRILLAEQLYRAFSIINGAKYHK